MPAQATEERTSLTAQLLDEFFPFASPMEELPDATPAEGPDPYGNPDPDPEWLRIDWREHLRRIDIGGARDINYVEMGPESGKALLLVHGLGGAWQNWLETIPHFAREHRVIALDLPGFGQAPLPDWEVSVEAYGRLVHEFADAIGIRTCTIVGNSMGGFVAAEAATRRQDRFEQLVLASAAGISHARMKRQPAEVAARMSIATAPLTLRNERRLIRRPRIRQIFFSGLFYAPHRLRPELLWEFLHHGTGKPGFVPAVQGLIGYDILDRLEDVEVPTMIVWGRNDHVVPPNDAIGYAKRLHNSRTVIFDKTGHVPMAERPVRFNRVLEAFLAD
ncbi:MAG: alpha/beta hydrolase [Actinobacteria bacterium]|nr:MAG: alpha/beta hydrolase [Actinomycetota bacterium]